jgi:hypothetical protein
MTDSLLGLIFIGLAAGLYLFGILPRKSAPTVLRTIPAMAKIRRALGLAVEEGTRMHVSLGRAGFLTSANASGFTALAALGQVARLSSISDRPPIATSGDPVFTLLGQDVLENATQQQGKPEAAGAANAQMAGATPMAYTVGVLSVIESELVSSNLLLGNFGPEVVLMLDAAERSSSFVLGASDSLPAQAVFTAAADEVLFGEEVFAVPAYLRGGDAYIASLRAEDVLRWVLIGALVIGSVLQFLGFGL